MGFSPFQFPANLSLFDFHMGCKQFRFAKRENKRNWIGIVKTKVLQIKREDCYWPLTPILHHKPFYNGPLQGQYNRIFLSYHVLHEYYWLVRLMVEIYTIFIKPWL